MDEHVAHEPPKAEGEPGAPIWRGPTTAWATSKSCAASAPPTTVQIDQANREADEAEGRRRVGPLRRIHMATLERAQELARPLVEQLLDLRRQVNAIHARAIDDVLEDLGATPREQGEDARVVEEGGETYVELMRAPTGPAKASQGPRRKG